MTARPWQEFISELVSTGLTAQQLTLLLSLVSAMSTGLSGGSPMGSSDGASETQREKWRNQKQKQRCKDKEKSAQMSTGLSTGQADNAPLTEVVLRKEGNRKEELLQPTLLEGQPSKPKRIVSRGTRLADDWSPTDKDRAFAGCFLGPSEVEIEAQKFRNYWTNRTDRSGSKPRWDRAWENWILNIKGGGGGQRGQRSLQDDSRSVTVAIDRRIEQAGQGTISFPPRPRLVPAECEDDRKLLPPGRSAES